MPEYIDRDKIVAIIKEDIRQCKEDAENAFGDEAYLQAVNSRENGVHYILCEIERQPVANVLEVKKEYKKGDVCLYGFADENKSLAVVEIVDILDDDRGVAKIKFLKVIVDDTGNGLFNYLLKTGETMNASFKYLKNIMPLGAEK